MENNRITGWAISALIFAFLIPPVGFILAIIALAKKKENHAGKIMAWVALIIGLISTIFSLVLFAFMGVMIGGLMVGAGELNYMINSCDTGNEDISCVFYAIDGEGAISMASRNEIVVTSLSIKDKQNVECSALGENDLPISLPRTMYPESAFSISLIDCDVDNGLMVDGKYSENGKEKTFNARIFNRDEAKARSASTY